MMRTVSCLIYMMEEDCNWKAWRAQRLGLLSPIADADAERALRRGLLLELQYD